MTEQKIPKESSILKKLLLWFLAVSLIPIAIIEYITHTYSVRALKEHILESNTALAEARAYNINQYILEKEKDVAVLACSPTAIGAIEEFNKVYIEYGIDFQEYNALEKKWKPFFTFYQTNMGYYDSFLISCNGDILFTIKKEKDYGTNLINGPYKDSELANVFHRAKTLPETGISDFKWYEPSDEPAAFIAAPIIKEERVIGIIAFQLSTEDLYNIVLNYEGLGETGEMVVATRIDNDAVFVAPLRHDPDAAFRKKISIGSQEALPIQEAVQGKAGSSISIDYRGKEILAVWRYLPLLRWGLVVKIDTEEAYKPIYDLRKLLLVIRIILLFTIVLVIFFAARSISNPIVKLTRLTKTIAGGDLRSDIKITSDDEIGQLADSFNTMVQSLKQAQKELVWKEKFAAIGRISGSIAHDIRHPLATINNSAYFLNMTLKYPDEKTKKHLKLISSEVAHANEIITSLMRLSELKQPEKNKIKINYFANEFFSVFPLPERTKLVTEFDNTCPAIMVDRSHLKQTFANLASNAVNAMPEGGTLTVKTRRVRSSKLGVQSKKEKGSELPARPAGGRTQNSELISDFVEISFADTGCGIKKDMQDNIFEPFYTTKSKGIGLGLSIVKDIITSNDGNITVESEEGKGSRFTIKFPAAMD